MKWHEPITLTVRILSPVAIGTGEKCNTLGFIVDGNKVLVVDERKFLGALSEQQQRMFLGWLEPLVGNLTHIREQIQRARDNKQLRRRLEQERRETEGKISLEKFLRETLRMPQPANWLRGKGALRYEITAVRRPDRYEGFALCLKTSDYCPYIPGSELKGAIRTAVLTGMLSANAQFLQNLAQRLHPNMRKRQLDELWQMTEYALLRAGSKDAHDDLFRGISISDSEPLSKEAVCVYAAKRLNMTRDVTVFTEAIAPNRETTVTLSVAYPNRWLTEAGLADKSGWLSWEKLAEALYQHSNAVLDFIAQKFPALRQRAQKLKEQNTPQEPLLRIGWGQGFLSVTMTEPLRQSHPHAYETLRQAMASVIGQYGRTKPNDFPKTIWAVLDGNGQPVDLFGWVKLIKR